MISNNTSNRQHFVKMMKHFSTRIVQAVVQSRMGNNFKVSHPCSVRNDNSVWFNLVIDEIGEIAAHLKQRLEKYSPISHPLYLEFTLHTAEGDYLPLEFWVIWIDENFIDENADIKAVVYSQLSTLLKSVIMAARFTPTYRYYVSKQHLDTYVILYKVSFGEPDYSILGEERKFKQLGTLPTPYGAIRMDLHYRTNMVILPSLIEIKSTQPQPIIKDDVEQRQFYCDIYGNLVPNKDSSIVASSPTMNDFNYFSTSPLSSDFPFVESDDEDDTKDLSSTITDGIYESKTQRHLSGGSNKSNSPKGTSGFLLKTRQQRTRNNSFPFSSLLIDSMSDQTKSQFLPKVPENVPISSALHQSTSEQTLNRKNYSKTRHYSLTSEPAFTLPLLEHHEENIEKKLKSSELVKDIEKFDENKDFSTKKKVVFECSVNKDEDNNTNITLNEKNNIDKDFEKNEIDDDRESYSSDDSFVKVIAFASNDNIYSDLTDFAQEVHSAPKNLASCTTECANELTKQIDEFRERALAFDSFVARLKEMDELNF